MKIGFILYAVMLMSGASLAVLSTEDAAKFVEPKLLFYLRGAISVINVASTGLKAYTSDAYSKWKDAKRNGIKTGDTDFINKATGP